MQTHQIKIMKALLLGTLLLLGFNQGAFAEEKEVKVKKARWYQINVTFFKQKHDRKLDESFNFEPVKMDMADTLSIHKDQTYQIVDSGMNAAMALHHENINSLSFTEQDIDETWVEVLSKLDPVSQPILYNAQWVQPVYASKFSLPLYFESSSDQVNQSQLKGLFHLYVARYLHSKIELQYASNDTSNQTISLTQSRRMRSKEVHYLDHPMIGALIRILPYEHPLTTEEKLLEEKMQQQTTDESALNARL